MVMANHMVGMVCLQKLPFQTQGLGKMYFETGEEGKLGKGEGGGKAMIFLDTCNSVVVGVS